jgi:hypothetical protein
MRPSDGRYSLWPVGVLAFIVVIAAASITPIVRLNSTPPSDFAALRATASRPDAAAAAGYWESAVSVIQWKYNRTSPLPEQAPAEFRLGDDSGKAATGVDRTARTAYWAKLREEWLKAENWHRTISFDLMWAVRDAQSLWHAIAGFVQDHM